MRYTAVFVMLVSAGLASNAGAQDPAKVIAERRAVESKVQAARVGVESRTTKGAPYAAEAVTESTQVLADGNRIVTKSTSRVYRDSEGRTRREQLDQNASEARNISISDPVAGTGYVLDPAKRQAFQTGVFIATTQGMATVAGRGGGAVGVVGVRTAEPVTVAGADQAEKVATELRVRTAAAEAGVVEFAGAGGRGGAVTLVSPGMMPARISSEGTTTSREELGQQMIEGVMATGTRTTTEIPAGKIGNEQAIRIVSEQWFSPDLQVLVLTKHSDPRVGETVYKLTGIIRAEQARTLFEVPADYTLRESEIRRLQK